VFVVGCSADKDIAGLAEELAPAAGRVIAARADHPRAMPPARIAEAFRALGVESEVLDGVAPAIDRALAVAGEGGVICVAGSLFVAAEGRERVRRRRTAL
jgi:dihydrofolate synthase/folylpolyglutamate synthase